MGKRGKDGKFKKGKRKPKRGKHRRKPPKAEVRKKWRHYKARAGFDALKIVVGGVHFMKDQASDGIHSAYSWLSHAITQIYEAGQSHWRW